MIKGVHFLLTYACTFECDHCFLYCGPWAQGTFTLTQVEAVLDQAQDLGSVDHVFFEGGEPLLYYPLLQEAVRSAHERGFRVGLVSNAYLSTSLADAGLWLAPLARAGLDFLSLSDDSFHHGGQGRSPASLALEKARDMGLDVDSIAILDPSSYGEQKDDSAKGAPVEGGPVRFRGRAVDKLAPGLADKPWAGLDSCPDEDFSAPSRVHVDAYGNVHLCQGLLMGNLWKTPLPSLVNGYRVAEHPICSALERGGPALLAREMGLDCREKYADACHLCFSLRLRLLDRYPELLGPRQVYGPGAGE